MSGNTGVDENLIPGVQTVIDGLPQVAPSGEIPGLPPEWSTPSKEGDDKTKGEIDDTKDTGDKVKDGAKKLHDKDKEGKDALDGIDGKTDLSSDGKSPSEGTPKVYPSSNQTPQQSMPQSQPQQQSMPQMSMPQTPQASMPQVSVPKDTFSKLAGNYNPSSSKSHDSDSKGKFSDPNGVNKGKLDASEVDLNKKGYGKLSLSELRTVMDKGLDANGITDEKARAQWKKVLEYMAIKESGLNADAVNTSDCVPLDNSILTQRGWLKHDEVRVGDMTLGYNFDNGFNEWTRITNIVHHENALVTHLSNSRWEAIVTPDHKWIVEPRLFRKDVGDANTYMFKTTRELNTRDKIVLSAAARTSSSLGVTMAEANNLGRMAVGYRPKRSVRRDLERRFGNPRSNAVETVIAMSHSERTAWLEGVRSAKGQIYGAVKDAVIAAAYMSGKRPSVRVLNGGWGAKVSEQTSSVSSRSLNSEDGAYQNVWCVTTELGSWTCRNGEHVFLTGNSNAHGAIAADGNPFNCSRGIWQTIPTTFAAYHVSGTSSSVYEPVANCSSAINYAMDRYNIPKEGGPALERFYQARGGGSGGYTGY